MKHRSTDRDNQPKKITGKRLCDERGHNPYSLAEMLRAGVRAWLHDGTPVIDACPYPSPKQDIPSGCCAFLPFYPPEEAAARDNWRAGITGLMYSLADVEKFGRDERKRGEGFGEGVDTDERLVAIEEEFEAIKRMPANKRVELVVHKEKTEACTAPGFLDTDLR